MEKKRFKLNIRKICFVLGVLLLLGAAAMTAYNLYTDWYAGEASQSIIEQMELPEAEEEPVAESRPAPEFWNGPMPEQEIDGELYIGAVYIPAIGINLPIHTEWGTALAKTAPCRYLGSAYTGTLIIAGHNYQRHFGKLKDLQEGDRVRITDVKGSVFWYEVIGFESIDMYDIDAMQEGDWDLTLFTCDASRVRRTTVRCREISRTPPKA